MKILISVLVKAQSRMQCMLEDEKGATMVEYALILGLIAVVCATAVGLVGTNVSDKYQAVSGLFGG